MHYFALIVLVTIGLAAGFQSVPFRRLHARTSVRMSDDASSVSIVPLEKENIEDAAAATGLFMGAMLAGPVGALAFGAAANYIVKKEGELPEALQGVGKVVIEVTNYAQKVNSKYELTDKASKAIGGAIDSSDIEALSTVKKTLAEASDKVKGFNEEYKLIDKVGDALTVAKDLSVQAIDKVGELNEKYDFVATAKNAASTATQKIKEQAGSA